MINLNDIVGKKFNMLTVLGFDHDEKDKNNETQHYYLCKCDCGNEKVINRHYIISGTVKSCGCIYRANLDDIIGQKFGMLTVLGFDHDEKDKENTTRHYYRCKCDCGNEIIVNRKDLLGKRVVSCGCKNKINDLDDIIGKRFGMLTVIKYAYRNEKDKRHYYLCKCDCGNEKIVRRGHLFDGNITSCGCKNKIDDLNDIVGQKFGRLTVMEYAYNKNKYHYYLCKCDCGNTCTVIRKNLFNGNTMSCGCYHKDKVSETASTHGMSKTRFYNIWSAMIQRCDNPNTAHYDIYGGRGITYDPKWAIFENFRDDMYESYLEHVAIYGEENTSIDRIDNNGNYCKENCRWATKEEQAYNTSRNRYVEYRGETLNIKELKNKYALPSLSEDLIRSRIFEKNWDVRDAILKPSANRDPNIISPVHFRDDKVVIHPIHFFNK